MTEIILGTAEFGHPDYAPHPDRRTIVRILNRAHELGIRKLDTADTYCLDFSLFGGFQQLYKTRSISSRNFYHYQPGEARKESIVNASVYDLDQLSTSLTSVIIPVNINNTKFLCRQLPANVYVRSVFDNGRLLKEGYTVADCIKFVKRLDVKGIIVGVRKVGELDEIMEAMK